MKPLVLSLALTLLAAPAGAACYADYKAKRDGPLRLHYGVIQLSDAACGDRNAAQNEAKTRLKSAGWKLLTLVSTFDQNGLDARRSDAGEFFLRY